MNVQTEKLKKQLGEFGLNPQDWNLFRLNSKNYLIKNKQENELCFWGQTEKKRWKELRLFEF